MLSVPSEVGKMKELLRKWCEILAQEYPEFVDRIPDPDKLSVTKLKGRGIMTSTCNLSQTTNCMVVASVNSHSIVCNQHKRNISVKRILDTVRNYVGTIIKVNLDNIAPEFSVFPRPKTMCQAIDKEFSLCTNLPKGMGFSFF